jgi:hypothetical protein
MGLGVISCWVNKAQHSDQKMLVAVFVIPWQYLKAAQADNQIALA